MKMPKGLKERWVAALRSGKYKQGSGSLCTVDGRYCCLGVLEMVADGAVETFGEDRQSFAMPSAEWYRAHKVNNKTGKITPGELADFNDDGHSFKTIADIIEDKVEVTDDDTVGGF